MRALRLDIDRIQRLARRHEQAVALLAAEGDIGAGFGQKDLADARAVRCENLDAVIAWPDPARADPDIAVDVDPPTIVESGLAVDLHVHQRARLAALVPLNIALPPHIVPLP